MNSKIALAPLFAFVLALLIAGAVIPYWPHNQPIPTPMPTQSPIGTPHPSAAPSAADLYFFPTIILFPLAIMLAIAIILLYFRKEPK